MKKVWELAPPAFEKMLDWLDKDRNIAGQKYESIRSRLVKIFNYRECLDSEALVDVVFDRVARKIDFLTETYQGDPAPYFFNVANKVFLEYRRTPQMVEMSPDILGNNNNHNNHNHIDEDFQPEYHCLKKCLSQLSEDKRTLILAYYSNEKGGKVKSHKQIAKEAGITMSNLHVRVHRLRVILQKCVLECLSGKD